jgi:carboxyl-terminal processing protease
MADQPHVSFPQSLIRPRISAKFPSAQKSPKVPLAFRPKFATLTCHVQIGTHEDPETRGRVIFLMRRRLSLLAAQLLPALILPLLVLQSAKADAPKALSIPTDPTDAHIAEIEADLLQSWQYSQHPFDQEIAGRMVDSYLETLDYSHIFFLQPDIDSFAPYRTNLQVLTLQDHDVSPCFDIFNRFMKRAYERINYVTNLLATNKFTFTGHERFVVNRHSLPYPKDMAEAKDFWKQELRCEYLEQLLMAQPIEFSADASFETNNGTRMGKFVFAKDKIHPLDFDHFPKALLSKDGAAIGTLAFGTDGTNATVLLKWPEGANFSRTTNILYSDKGVKIGDIHFHRVTTIKLTPISTNTLAVSNNASTNTLATTNFAAVIHLDETNFAAINKTLTNHYGQMLDNFKELESDRVFEMYMNALARSYDPHSDYMGHLEAENFAIQMKLSLFGIGAILTKDGNYCKIMELKEGPAMKSGQIKAGDRIVAVAQSNSEPVVVVGMPLDKIVQMIRGPKGTQVTLTTIPVDAADTVHKEVTLMRDEIKLEDQQAKATLYEVPSSNGPPLKLGLVDLNSFYADQDHPEKNTTSDVLRLINRLKQEKVDGIILDLRRNGGGYLEEAIKLTGLFNPRGPVVQTKDPNGEIVPDTSPESGPLYDGPLVVLTSVFSASASEILAGALQDYGRALMVGDHSTFGKGTVQTMQDLSTYLNMKKLDYSYDPGRLKITIKKFYRAGGVSTQLQGVLSDVELPSVDDAADVGERSLPYAMPCDSVTSADHVEQLQLNRVKPYLPDLQSRSKARVDKNKDFEYIREDIAQYRKEQADKSLSLNYADRVREQKDFIAKLDARKKERLARKKSDEKIYEITLKNVDSEKLEPLKVKKNLAAAKTDVDLDSDEETPASTEAPAIDPTLEETKRILADYIELLKKGPGLSQAVSNPASSQ